MKCPGVSISPSRYAAFKRYLLVIAIGNAAWEAAQLPLYTLWQNGTPRQITVAVLHCTAGDIAIAAVTLTVALLLGGTPGWPETRRLRTTIVSLVSGIGYTTYSEYVNTPPHGATWACSDYMPTLPWFGIGAAPLAQWLIVPLLALAWATKMFAARATIAADSCKPEIRASSISRPAI